MCASLRAVLSARMAMPSLENVLCLDFEASGLGRSSYPIEVAVVDCLTTACTSWLIRPMADWLRNGIWSDEAAVIHQIALFDLMAHGRPVAQVARELADCCRGKTVLCDGGEHDWQWLALLFANVDQRPPFKLSDYGQCARELACRSGRDLETAIAAAELEALSRFPKLHRAGTDARRLAETLRLLVG